jgi:F-type H+/Na+-transporting ATPase subunit alpha
MRDPLWCLGQLRKSYIMPITMQSAFAAIVFILVLCFLLFYPRSKLMKRIGKFFNKSKKLFYKKKKKAKVNNKIATKFDSTDIDKNSVTMTLEVGDRVIVSEGKFKDYGGVLEEIETKDTRQIARVMILTQYGPVIEILPYAMLRPMDAQLNPPSKNNTVKKTTKMLAGITPYQKPLVLKKQYPLLKEDIEKNQKTGVVVELTAQLIKISSESNSFLHEVISFDDQGIAVVMKIESNFVLAFYVGSSQSLSIGSKVYFSGEVMKIGVGKNLLGRVIDVMSCPVDGQGALEFEASYPLFSKLESGKSQLIEEYQRIETGIMMIDVFSIIAKGEPTLIVGDCGSGKSTMALTSIINQRDKGTKCIYVSVGQSHHEIDKVINILRRYDALSYTTVITSGLENSGMMRYLSVFSGCAMAEYYRDQGDDVLVVFDDMTKHADAYRELSLLLEAPVGVERYPSDINAVYAALFDHCGNFMEEGIKRKGQKTIADKKGSITMMPVVDVLDADSAILRCLMASAKKGIQLETKFAKRGQYPAFDFDLSVAESYAMLPSKIITKIQELRLALAQHHELVAFTQFSSDLDEHTTKVLERGKRLLAVFKQLSFETYANDEVLLLLLAMEYKFFDEINIEQITGEVRLLISRYRYLDQKSKKALKLCQENFTGLENPLIIAFFKSCKD